MQLFVAQHGQAGLPHILRSEMCSTESKAYDKSLNGYSYPVFPQEIHRAENKKYGKSFTGYRSLGIIDQL